MKRAAFRTKAKLRPSAWFSLVISVSLVPVLDGWIASILMEWWLSGAISTQALYMLIGSTVLLLLLLGIIVSQGRKLLPTRVVEQIWKPQEKKVVIAMLSPCTNMKCEEGVCYIEGGDGVKHSIAGRDIQSLVSPGCGLPKWTWQQTLRTANCHRHRLEKLILLGSRDGSGTEEQLKLAQLFFEPLFPGRVYIPALSATGQDRNGSRWTVDFENLRALIDLLRDVIQDVLEDPMGYRKSDIVIDCTGGYKVTSIAAAMVTLDHPDILFQYVNNDGEVIAFNAVSERYSS